MIGNKPVGYNKVTLFGESYANYIWILNNEADNDLINSTKPYNFKPKWNGNTVLLANFDNNLNAGSIQSLNEDIKSWSVYRKKKDSQKLEFVEKTIATKNYSIDYNISNKKEYVYYVFPETENTVGEPMKSEPISTYWCNWSLIGIKENGAENTYYADTDNIWLLEMNLSSGDMNQNIDKQVYDNFTTYPKVSVGERNYITGTVTCLLGSILSATQDDDTSDRMTKFSNFIKNKDKKILKDRKGNIFLIDTIGNSFKTIDNVYCQSTYINFSYVQIGSTDGISIIEK